MMRKEECLEMLRGESWLTTAMEAEKHHLLKTSPRTVWVGCQIQNRGERLDQEADGSLRRPPDPISLYESS